MAELWDTYIWPAVWIVFLIVLIVTPVLLSVAYLTLAERKVIGWMQFRKGPNVVGPFGLLQPIADGAKLFLKETVVPSVANRVIFILAPMITWKPASARDAETSSPMPEVAPVTMARRPESIVEARESEIPARFGSNFLFEA